MAKWLRRIWLLFLLLLFWHGTTGMGVWNQKAAGYWRAGHVQTVGVQLLGPGPSSSAASASDPAGDSQNVFSGSNQDVPQAPSSLLQQSLLTSGVQTQASNPVSASHQESRGPQPAGGSSWSSSQGQNAPVSQTQPNNLGTGSANWYTVTSRAQGGSGVQSSGSLGSYAQSQRVSLFGSRSQPTSSQFVPGFVSQTATGPLSLGSSTSAQSTKSVLPVPQRQLSKPVTQTFGSRSWSGATPQSQGPFGVQSSGSLTSYPPSRSTGFVWGLHSQPTQSQVVPGFVTQSRNELVYPSPVSASTSRDQNASLPSQSVATSSNILVVQTPSGSEAPSSGHATWHRVTVSGLTQSWEGVRPHRRVTTPNNPYAAIWPSYASDVGVSQSEGHTQGLQTSSGFSLTPGSSATQSQSSQEAQGVTMQRAPTVPWSSSQSTPGFGTSVATGQMLSTGLSQNTGVSAQGQSSFQTNLYKPASSVVRQADQRSPVNFVPSRKVTSFPGFLSSSDSVQSQSSQKSEASGKTMSG